MRGQLTRAQLEARRERKNANYLPDFGRVNPVHSRDLSRCWMFDQMKSAPFLIATAFRKKTSLAENRSLNRLLIEDFKRRGLGGLKFRGHYQEDERSPVELTETVEVFFLTFNEEKATIDRTGFEEFARSICSLYEQDFVIYSDGEVILALDSQGGQEELGLNSELSLHLIEDYFSSRRNKKFLVEGFASPSGYIHAMSMGMDGIHGWYRQPEPAESPVGEAIKT